jgi:osmotically-inducible protein OsmY
MQIRFSSARVWALAVFVSPILFGIPAISQSQDQASPPASSSPDNSGQNKYQNKDKIADNQKESTSDREITQKIRRAIVSDKSLSTYAHNVKIITQGGQVTLKGPVRSDDEKSSIASKAAEVAGQDKVTNELSVKQ